MPDKGTMTINQALKTRKVVDKRIASKVQESINLCCHSSVLKPAFENTPGRVKRLMQSAEDLIRYRGELDRAIVVANTAKKISFRGGEYTLLELLDLRGRGKDKNGLLRQKRPHPMTPLRLRPSSLSMWIAQRSRRRRRRQSTCWRTPTC